MNKIKTSVRIDEAVLAALGAYADERTGGDKTQAINKLLKIALDTSSHLMPPSSPDVTPRLDRLEQEVKLLKEQQQTLLSLITTPRASDRS